MGRLKTDIHVLNAESQINSTSKFKIKCVLYDLI
jgi:hypothetical protein